MKMIRSRVTPDVASSNVVVATGSPTGTPRTPTLHVVINRAIRKVRANMTLVVDAGPEPLAASAGGVAL